MNVVAVRLPGREGECIKQKGVSPLKGVKIVVENHIPSPGIPSQELPPVPEDDIVLE
jgi:hypothetical protein